MTYLGQLQALADWPAEQVPDRHINIHTSMRFSAQKLLPKYQMLADWLAQHRGQGLPARPPGLFLGPQLLPADELEAHLREAARQEEEVRRQKRKAKKERQKAAQHQGQGQLGQGRVEEQHQGQGEQGQGQLGQGRVEEQHQGQQQQEGQQKGQQQQEAQQLEQGGEQQEGQGRQQVALAPPLAAPGDPVSAMASPGAAPAPSAGPSAAAVTTPEQPELAAAAAAAAAPAARQRIILCCLHCSKVPGQEGLTRLRRCRGCDVGRYCSSACQAAHWPQHRQQCLQVSAAKQSVQDAKQAVKQARKGIRSSYPRVPA